MPIKLSGLVDFEKFKEKSEKKQEELKRERGHSKSGLDWEADEDVKEPDTEDVPHLDEDGKDQADLVEAYIEEEDENRSLKAHVKSIHKHAAELYNLLDDQEDPEEWVIEKAKDAADAIMSIHSHIDYAKNKDQAELRDEPDDMQEKERGW